MVGVRNERAGSECATTMRIDDIGKEEVCMPKTCAAKKREVVTTMKLHMNIKCFLITITGDQCSQSEPDF